ncbi:hypothetical protein L210DRAFT_3511575 [Boletus edulis BED1]|uniref:DUF159-domain-containing protein n=1 Tax=Boletus edulis BED1 TaxID=1328754 RepID=A0AAD4G672_BOLED|nr:hypothetical protein L210DRAFT_3511575 [Boletus edulis BED1]
MCGRYALGLQRAQIRALPGYPHLAIGEWIGENDFVPRYNIAPNTNAPVIRRCTNAGPSTTHPESDAKDTPSSSLIMQTMRWGIHYGKQPSKGSQAINARSENLIEGVGMWNKFRGKGRCIVVCQGYYEWQTKGKDKLPHFTKHPDGKVMLMAGLYEETSDKRIAFLSFCLGIALEIIIPVSGQSQSTYTFAIVTTDASRAMSWLHDRQPVILSSADEINRWLDTSSRTWSSDLARLLHPWEDTTAPLQCYQVPKELGKVGTESPKFIEPVAERKDGIMAMFAKQKSKQAESSVKRKRSSSPTRLLSIPKTATKKEEHEEKKVKLV